MITMIEPSHPVVVRRVADDGKRNPPALNVTAGDIFDFHVIPSYEPGGPERMAARIRRTTRDFIDNNGKRHPQPWPEWLDADEETIIIDPGNSGVLLAALGHRIAGHRCADCAGTS